MRIKRPRKGQLEKRRQIRKAKLLLIVAFICFLFFFALTVAMQMYQNKLE